MRRSAETPEQRETRLKNDTRKFCERERRAEESRNKRKWITDVERFDAGRSKYLPKDVAVKRQHNELVQGMGIPEGSTREIRSLVVGDQILNLGRRLAEKLVDTKKMRLIRSTLMDLVGLDADAVGLQSQIEFARIKAVYKHKGNEWMTAEEREITNEFFTYHFGIGLPKAVVDYWESRMQFILQSEAKMKLKNTLQPFRTDEPAEIEFLGEFNDSNSRFLAEVCRKYSIETEETAEAVKAEPIEDLPDDDLPIQLVKNAGTGELEILLETDLPAGTIFTPITTDSGVQYMSYTPSPRKY
jgi:hypothetical protein